MVAVVISLDNWNHQYPLTGERSQSLYFGWRQFFCVAAQQWEGRLFTSLGLEMLSRTLVLAQPTLTTQSLMGLKGTWDTIWLLTMWNTLTLQRPKLKKPLPASGPSSAGLKRSRTFCETVPGAEDTKAGSISLSSLTGWRGPSTVH